MNIGDLNNIIEKYYSFNNVALSKLNVDDKEYYDLVIVTPTWKPHYIFDNNYSVETLKIGSVSTYNLYHDNKKILFLRTGKGAPNLYDNLLLIRNINAPYLFLGSAGSLNEKINEGDIFVPKYSISGDGASLYFNQQFNISNFNNKVFFDKELEEKIFAILKKEEFNYFTGGVYSIDSLIGEYYHLNMIRKQNASCIEQETAAFGKCMNIMEKSGLPILVISDSLITGVNYYEPYEDKQEYLHTRTKKLQLIINDL